MLRRIQASLINRSIKTLMFLLIVSLLFLSLATSFIWKDATNTIYSQINSVMKPEIVLKSDLVIADEFGLSRSPIFSNKSFNGKHLDITSSSQWEKYNDEYYNDLTTLINNYDVYYADINMVNTGDVFLVPSLSESEFYVSINTMLSYRNDYTNDVESSVFTVYNTLLQIFNSNNPFMNFYNRLSSVSRSDFSDWYYSDLGEDFFISGRSFSDEELENGEYKIILNGPMYYCDGETYRELNVGDTITYSLYTYNDSKKVVSKTFDFEIIGITNISTKNLGDNSQYNYIPQNTFLKIMKEIYPLIKGDLYYSDLYMGEYAYFPTYITLNSLEYLESFINEVDNLNDEKGRTYLYETNASNFIVLAGNLESVFTSFNILYIFSIIASIVILFSLITIDVNSRKKEIGILMSLGEDKSRIAICFILEYLLKIILSLLISLLITNIITFKLGNLLLNSDIAELANGTSSIFFDAGELNDTPILKVSLSFTNILKILLIVLSISLPSIISSILYISHFNPKEVLKDE